MTKKASRIHDSDCALEAAELRAKQYADLYMDRCQKWSDTREKLEAAEREIERLRAKLEPHADEVCIKQDKWEEELSYAESQRERISALEAEIERLCATIVDRNERLEAAEREVERLRKIDEEIAEELDKLDPLRARIAALEQELAEGCIDGEFVRLRAENVELKEALEAICTHFDTDRLAKNIARAALVKTLKMCSRIDTSFSGLACKEAADEIERLRAKLKEAEEEYDLGEMARIAQEYNLDPIGDFLEWSKKRKT